MYGHHIILYDSCYTPRNPVSHICNTSIFPSLKYTNCDHWYFHFFQIHLYVSTNSQHNNLRNYPHYTSGFPSYMRYSKISICFSYFYPWREIGEISIKIKCHKKICFNYERELLESHPYRVG